jgi:hypothetical protein
VTTPPLRADAEEMSWPSPEEMSWSPPEEMSWSPPPAPTTVAPPYPPTPEEAEIIDGIVLDEPPTHEGEAVVDGLAIEAETGKEPTGELPVVASEPPQGSDVAEGEPARKEVVEEEIVDGIVLDDEPAPEAAGEFPVVASEPPQGSAVDEREPAPRPSPARTSKPDKKRPARPPKKKRGLLFKLLILTGFAMFGCCCLSGGGVVAVGSYLRLQEEKVVGKWVIDPTYSTTLRADDRSFQIEFQDTDNKCIMSRGGIELRGVYAAVLNASTETIRINVAFGPHTPPGGTLQKGFNSIFDITVIDPDHIDIVDLANNSTKIRMKRANK